MLVKLDGLTFSIVCAYVCVRVCARMRACVCVCSYAFVYIGVGVYVCVCVYMCVYFKHRLLGFAQSDMSNINNNTLGVT